MLNELNLALRSGDVWVVGSRQFLPLDGYLLPQTEWANRPLAPGQLTCEQYLEPRRPQLHDGLERILSLLADGKLPDIALEAGRLSITPLEAEAPPEAEGWSDRLYDLLPRVQITDLLSEVDSWTGFTGHFLHLYKQQPAADRATVLAVILSDATNLGLAKIAEAMPGRSDRHLSRVADWHVREENYAKALADLIHKQHEVPLAAHWGSGSTSSSDGQAFPIGTRKPVLADTNAKYGRDPVVMIYSHISDRYAPFYTKAIRSNARDAPYVLDGLLEHGAAGLRIDEHYTDTGGVTEQVFALCHLLGFRFAPRIRDLPDRRLYTFRPLKQYGILKELAADVADTELIERNWDQMMRVAESIRMGKVSASLVVNKLAAYPRGSEVARALRELGRIERTLYTLDWLQQPELRRRVQAGLNKGELRNSLARAIRFYRRGSVGDRDREEQQRKASGLNLVIGARSACGTRCTWTRRSPRWPRPELRRQNMCCPICRRSPGNTSP